MAATKRLNGIFTSLKRYPTKNRHTGRTEDDPTQTASKATAHFGKTMDRGGN